MASTKNSGTADRSKSPAALSFGQGATRPRRSEACPVQQCRALATTTMCAGETRCTLHREDVVPTTRNVPRGGKHGERSGTIREKRCFDLNCVSEWCDMGSPGVEKCTARGSRPRCVGDRQLRWTRGGAAGEAGRSTSSYIV